MPWQRVAMAAAWGLAVAMATALRQVNEAIV